MSSPTIHENSDAVQTSKDSNTLGIPPGNYRLVGWDMDTTGKRLVDEICQIAVYTPEANYSQYVMPFENLSPPAMRRHHLKIVTIGRYRVLKNSDLNQILKTKSEMSALLEFLGWLEKMKGDATDGIILVHHELRRIIPSILIEALAKYKYLNKFKEIVKGFANGFDIAKVKCANTLKAFSLRTLARMFFNKDEDLSSASQRAQLALETIQHLSIADKNEKSSDETEIGSGDNDEKAIKATVEFVREFVQPVAAQEQECAELKLVMMRQDTLKPIFKSFLTRVPRRKRQQISPLRRLLAESTLDFNQLLEAWNDKEMEGLETLIKRKVKTDEKGIKDIMGLLECYFDPEKKPSYNEENNNISKIKSDNKFLNDNNNNNNNKDFKRNELPKTTLLSPIMEKISIED